MPTKVSSFKVDPVAFYSNWSGHPIADLNIALTAINQSRPSKPIIWLAGDSSLDNKAWIPFPDSAPNATSATPDKPSVPVPKIYTSFLSPATPKQDVAFWLNSHLGEKATCLNTAIEATTLRNRVDTSASKTEPNITLLPQDTFLASHISRADILIVSIGANDIALAPTLKTILWMAKLAWLTPRRSLNNGSAWGLGYFRNLFGTQVSTYIRALTAEHKPKAVVVCMIYFPDQRHQKETGEAKGWADLQLKLLGYNLFPGQLQAAIERLYRDATCKIDIEGMRVVPCPLFEVLDGTVTGDYVERVEPSVQGGRKMAGLLGGIVDGLLDEV